MRNIKKKLSALVLTTVFATMQISYANIDTGLGSNYGGATIIDGGAGYAGINGVGTSNVDLNFNANSHVQWDTLNLNAGERLNFNAVDGASGLTILNTVNRNMSNIYGSINANEGISNLILSNPNGMFFNGSNFTTAADANVTITAQGAAMGTNGAITYDPSKTRAYTPDGTDYVIQVQDSNFSVGGELNFIAPTMNVVKSAFDTKNGTGNVKFTTTNGQDYFVTQTDANGNTITVDYNDPEYDAVITIGTGNGCCTNNYKETQSMRLEAIKVDGDVYITNNKGIVKTVSGGEINGNLNVNTGGTLYMNYVDNGKTLKVSGNTNVVGDAARMYARTADFKGNLNMENGGGYLEVKDVNVEKDMNLKTVARTENPYGYKHFTHVNGNTTVKGNATIDSENNIHIGNYKTEDASAVMSGNVTSQITLLDGNLSVGGDLTAHAHNGHVTTTIDVQADKINYTSDKLNILTDENSVLTANEYSFKSNGYIGAIKDYVKANGEPYPAPEQIIGIMETYTYIPKDIKSHAYTKIAGGTITNIETPKDAKAYIGSYGDVLVTGANAGDINITAYNKDMKITGPNVHANNINVGSETNYLTLDFPGRDFKTNYTNIRDGVVVTVRPDEVITYELTNAPNGYNSSTYVPGENTTYLVGPGAPETPEPNPISNDDNARLLHNNWAPDDVTAAPVNTPVAFAADLDDDEEEAGVRKNVDGSVTVVRAFPMMGS